MEEKTHSLNMELDLQSLLDSCVQLYPLAETPQLPPSPAFEYTRALWYWSAKIDDSSLGRYVFGSEISYNKAPLRLPGLAC
jgi:hypothetical protein